MKLCVLQATHKLSLVLPAGVWQRQGGAPPHTPEMLIRPLLEELVWASAGPAQ